MIICFCCGRKTRKQYFTVNKKGVWELNEICTNPNCVKYNKYLQF